MISHALIIREQQRQESLDEAARQQRVAHHYPPTRFGGHLPHRLGQVFLLVLADARWSRTTPRVAPQS